MSELRIAEVLRAMPRSGDVVELLARVLGASPSGSRC
jgi:hypothetical protein